MTPKKRLYWLDHHAHHLLGALILCGAALRWRQIGEPSFWYDEAAEGLIARLPVAAILANQALIVTRLKGFN